MPVYWVRRARMRSAQLLGSALRTYRGERKRGLEVGFAVLWCAMLGKCT